MSDEFRVAGTVPIGRVTVNGDDGRAICEVALNKSGDGLAITPKRIGVAVIGAEVDTDRPGMAAMSVRIVAALLLLASSAAAQPRETPFQLWTSWVDASFPANPHTFRFGTSEAGYIEINITGDTAGGHFRAADGANVATLIAEMTNGVNDGFQYTNGVFDYAVDENRFFTSGLATPPPVRGYSGEESLWGPVDLQGMIISSVFVAAGRNDSGFSRYEVSVFGHAPEPSSGLLFVLGGCLLHGGLRGSSRWRRPSTAR